MCQLIYSRSFTPLGLQDRVKFPSREVTFLAFILVEIPMCCPYISLGSTQLSDFLADRITVSLPQNSRSALAQPLYGNDTPTPT